jgi:hypothetical protein
MKKKVIEFLKKVYANEHFNTFCVGIAWVLGLINTWPGIAFVGLYLVGAGIVATAKAYAEPNLPSNEVIKQLNKRSK